MVFWLIGFILFFILTLRFRKIQDALRDCVDVAKERRLERKLRKEWKKILPNIPTHKIEAIFDYYGLISPKEFILIQYEIEEIWLRGVEQIFALLIHLSRRVWRLILTSLANNNYRIREILREQIKVIDDEEMILLSIR